MNKFAEIKKIKRAAYHEAGHAVANLIFGLPFQSISLKQEQKPGYLIEDGQKVDATFIYTIGIVFPEERNDSVNKTLMAGILDIKEALSSMAGPVAERIFVGKIDDQAQTGARNDVQVIAACCRAALSGSDNPEEWQKLPEMENLMVASIAAGADHLLRDNWISVKAIAEILIEKKELGYMEASRIAEAKGLSKKG
jgi:hypothetical protein